MLDWILPSIDGELPPVTRPMIIVDGGRPAECSAFAGRQAKLPEAVEQVAADLLAEIGGDRVVRSDQGLGRRQTAVNRDVLGHCRPRQRCCKQASRGNIK